jgi:ACR3 family arsenite efflux pump ArsB
MYAFGILLLALLPTSGMTISWTGFAHGNINIAIKASVIGLLSGALLTPFYGNILMGQTIEIPLLKTFQKIGLIIFIPLIVGWLTQYVLIKKAGIEKFNRVIKPKFPLLATISVLGIIFVALALKAKTISTQPELLLKLLFPVFVFYSINFLFTTIIGRLFFVYEDAIALVYGTTVRTLSVALAISMTLFADQGSDIVLIISAAYIVQLQAAAWYVKFADFLLKPSKNRGKTP